MHNITEGKEDFKGLIIIGLTMMIVILLGGVGYIYKTKKIVPKNSIAPSIPTTETSSVDNNLPSDIQENYILKSTHIQELHKIKKEKELLEKDLEDIIDNTIHSNAVTDHLQFKTYTCKSFQKGSIAVPRSCEKSLYKFLDTYKHKAKKFEIIGMVDRSEFKLIQKVEDVYGPTAEVKEIKKYVQIGLSRQRVIETTWLAKQYLPKYAIINPVNYNLYNNDKRGFVIRAYF